jgi:hypothetical protein
MGFSSLLVVDTSEGTFVGLVCIFPDVVEVFCRRDFFVKSGDNKD